MKRLLITFLLLSLCVSPVSAFVLAEFCPDGYASGDGDEYFILEGTGSLTGWTVTDGEGTLSFPAGSASTGEIIVARSAEAYNSIHGTFPDYEILETGTTPNVLQSGRFQMANTGDELSLLYNGKIVSTVSWPDELAASNVRVHVYSDGVWDERIYKIGQSRFSPETFTADRGAEVRVMLDCMYYNTEDEADNDELAAELNRYGPNISGKLILPGEYLTKLHNKGMIVDGGYVLISSINWNYNSPNNNREAGLIIQSIEAAEYYTAVFAYDWNGDFDKDPVSAGIGFDVRFLLAGGIVILLIGILIYRRR